MNIPVRIARTVLVAAFLGAVRTDAQTADAPAANVARRAPRVGVVLSGGGARGIAHIGVLRVLEDEGVVADIVTGASMGALVGGLYAIGYTPAALDSLATGLEWESYFRDAPERRFQSLDRRFTGDRTLLTLPLEHGRVRLPTGAISGQRISQLLSRLTWDVHTERDFGRFRRPFAAIATDIVTGAAVVLDSGSLAEAMQASMSIPSLFPPARMNDRLLIDGGITRNLPARDARSLGADILICSDVSAPLHPASRLHSLVDVLMQTVTIYMSASNEVERALCDVSIRPNADGLTAADFDRAAAWIERGMHAAAAARPQLRDIAARTSARRSDEHAAPRRARILGDSVRAAAVLIDGVSGAPARSLHRALRLTDGWVTATRLDAAITRAYATELFDQVRYRIEPREADTIIVVNATAREQDRLGIGLRFDDTYKASVLATARLRNRIGFGSTTQFDLRLGEQTRVAAHHVNVGIGGSRLTVETAAAYNRTPLPVVIDGERIDDARIDATAITTFAGVMLTDGAVVGLELRSDHSRARATMATGDTALRRSFTSGALIIRSNTLDRGAFPTRGALLSLRSEHALGNERFEQHVGHAQIAVPLARRLAVHGRATVGASSPEDALPVHYVFMLGGSYPSALFPETQVGFPGLRPQQFAGAATARLGSALQWEARRNVFATVRADVGYAGRTLRFDREASMTGVGISLGALTPVGPLEVSAGTLVRKARMRVELSLGHPF